MGQENSYILVDNYLYVNRRISLITLYLLLFFKAKPFEYFEQPTKFNVINASKLPVIRAIRVFKFVWLFQIQKKVEKKSTFLDIHCYGHCALLLAEKECKVFDLQKEMVYTIYPPSRSESYIRKKLEQVKMAGELMVGPKYISANIKERIVVEEYINAYRLNYSVCDSTDLFPLLKKMVAVRGQREVNLLEYLKDRRATITSLLNEKIMCDISSEENMLVIEEFKDQISTCIQQIYKGESVYLCLSHGDLWHGNLLKDQTRIRVIDWNTLDVRNCYYDFFFMSFVAAKKENIFVHLTSENSVLLLDRINQHFLLMQSNLSDVIEPLYRNKTDANLQRYIFYLEFIELKLQLIKKGHINYINGLLNWIERFTSFEKNVGAILFSNVHDEGNMAK